MHAQLSVLEREQHPVAAAFIEQREQIVIHREKFTVATGRESMENILGLTVPAGSAYRLSQPIEMTSETWRTDTIVDILRRRASELPDKTAFVFLVDGDQPEERRLTYAELHRQACAVAAHLVDTHATGDRVLLFYPPGLDFVTALFGCLYAGIVAVPAYPPRNESNLPRIAAILSDARASTVLTTVKTLAMVRALVDRHSLLGACRYITTDSLPATPSFERFAAAPDRLALLQYTSGSTGSPKGVMVSHANVTYNSLYIQRSFSLHDRSVSASWLPSFHDMGLMDGVIQPIYTGFLGVIIPPVSFVQKPVRWLAAIAKYRATHCGSPNFGYELCVEKISREQSLDLDLSCWESAYNGAEPVRRATLERFTRRFAENGDEPAHALPLLRARRNHVDGVGRAHRRGPDLCGRGPARAREGASGVRRSSTQRSTGAQRRGHPRPRQLRPGNSGDAGPDCRSGDPPRVRPLTRGRSLGIGAVRVPGLLGARRGVGRHVPGTACQ